MTGDFTGLDRWLEALGSDPWSLSGIPDLEEVRKSGPRELRTQKRNLKKARNSTLKCLFKQPSIESIAAAQKDPRRSNLPPCLNKLGHLLHGSLTVPEGVDQSSLISRPGYVDLFSGNHGVAIELARLTGRWVLTYDIKDSAEQDLLDPEVQEEIKNLLKNGSVLGLGAAPVCSSLSRAITPAWRSSIFPEGIPGLPAHPQAKVDQGNQFAKFVAEIADLCLQLHIPFWIENPWALFIWSLPDLLKLRERPGVGFWFRLVHVGVTLVTLD